MLQRLAVQGLAIDLQRHVGGLRRVNAGSVSKLQSNTRRISAPERQLGVTGSGPCRCIMEWLGVSETPYDNPERVKDFFLQAVTSAAFSEKDQIRSTGGHTPFSPWRGAQHLAMSQGAS